MLSTWIGAHAAWGLLPLAATAVLAAIELFTTFSKCPRWSGTASFRFALAIMAFAILGYVVYVVWWLVFTAGLVTAQVGSVSGQTDGGVALISTFTVQAFRVELLQKAVDGNPKVVGDKDSIYATLIRLVQAAIYRGALPERPWTAPERAFVATGLATAYDSETLMKNFDTWVSNLNDTAQRDRLRQSAKDNLEDAHQDDYSKRSNIATLILQADPTQARALAAKRAASIVDQGAF